MVVLENPSSATEAAALPHQTANRVAVESELAARRELRRQIGLLERRAAAAFVALAQPPYDAPPPPAPASPRGGPWLLDLGALERERERLLAQLDRLAQTQRVRDARRARAHARLEAMLAQPGRHRFERVALAELGAGGCGVYQVRPRLGLLGMLAGWWEVKLSSGCP